MIIKAQVTTNSAQDPDKRGRVKIESPQVWENSGDSEFYVPSLNALPLNAGDWVYVYVPDSDFANPLVLGKCRDTTLKPLVEGLEDYTILWETVDQPDPEDESTKTWSALYAVGDTIYFENSKGTKFTLAGPYVGLDTDSTNISLDDQGNILVSTKGTVDVAAEGESSLQPVPFGDTLKKQLEALTSRLDATIDAVGKMLSAGIPAPMDGGAGLKASMQASWQASVPGIKSNSPSAEDWSEILNKSVSTAGKV